MPRLECVSAKYAGKTSFLAFPQDLVINFLIFFSKMCFSNAQNMAKSDFREKILPAGNMLEIAVSADFLWTFSTYFVVLFHTKALMISFLRSFVRSHARSPRSFVLSLAGRSNQHVAC